uniref:Major facilitator superfamily (MFS) profile domain-containing protein n=1 Tax=Bubo bubo TaxID=30461 RepID=A0A8C0E5Q8_BUBBB
ETDSLFPASRTDTFIQPPLLGIGGSFPYGFHISVINYPSVHIRKFINETWIERYGSPLHPETIMLLWSFIVSVYGIGGFLGSLCCGYLTTKYRKKKCQMCTNLIMLVAALFMAFSKTAKSFEMILIGRFLYGIGTGFSLNIHPQYVGEISPKKLRGFTNSTVAVFLTLGKLTGQVIGLREILGSEALWPWLLASSGLSALVQLVTLPFFPDSPSYLLIQKGNEEACRKAIRKLWGEGDHQAEIDDIMKEKVAMTSTKTLRVLEVIKERSLRWQLYILMTVMTTLQLCGINAVECSLYSQNKRQLYSVLQTPLNFYFPYSVSHFCLQDNLGPFCFLIFLGILALSAIFIYLYLPETKGKSIMEIKAEFNKLNFGKKETSVPEQFITELS